MLGRRKSKAPTAIERRHMDRIAQMGCDDRFWSKVDKRGHDDCWPWLSTKAPRGYGQFWLDGRYKPATHIALALHGNPQPPEAPFALHSCDNPPCVNPIHLRWGTPQENMDDRKRRGRANSCVGASHGRAKLREDVVRLIRLDTRPQKDIASSYGIGQSAVSRIKAGKSWGHSR